MQIIAGLFVNLRDDATVPLEVRPRHSLSELPDTVVSIGRAPDGLPLLLEVERVASVASAVCRELGTKRERLPPPIETALARLDSEVRTIARSTGIQRLAPGDVLSQPRAAYVTAASLDFLLGEPMLARILGAQSPLILPEDRWSPSSQPERAANTAMIQISELAAAELAKVQHVPTLAVPLDDSRPLVLAARRRDFVCEDLRDLPSARFHATLPDGAEREGELTDARAYGRALRDARRIAWSVERHDVAVALVKLARRLGGLHAEGRLHGDLKPGNVLLTANGPTAFDALELKTGELSPAATPGWAAPEQTLVRPCSGTTDVYALGLMAVSLVGGAVHGEERTFVIPTGGTDRRRLRLLANPEVFLDPGTLALGDRTRLAWQTALARWISLDRRPADGLAFATELEGLLALERLPGRMPLRGGPGRLVRTAAVDGKLSPSWVITDRRSPALG